MYHSVNNTVHYLYDDKLAVADCEVLIKERGSMSNFCCLKKAVSIDTVDGVTTITLSIGEITGLCYGQKFLIGIFTSIPNESLCNRIEVTDGTTTLDVYWGKIHHKGKQLQRINQYWRPRNLISGSIINVQYLNDPEILVLV